MKHVKQQRNQRDCEMPKSKVKGKWANVRIPQGLMEKADEFLRSARAKDLGLNSRADLISYVVREHLKKEQYV